jgi:hypothetical protein
MVRYISCLALALLVGTPLWASELDAEFRGKAPPAPAATQDVVRPLNGLASSHLPPAHDARAAAVKGSELDQEKPAQCCCWGWGWGGCCWGGWGWPCCGWGWGWGGWGWGGWCFPTVAYYPAYIGWGGYCW